MSQPPPADEEQGAEPQAHNRITPRPGRNRQTPPESAASEVLSPQSALEPAEIDAEPAPRPVRRRPAAAPMATQEPASAPQPAATKRQSDNTPVFLIAVVGVLLIGLLTVFALNGAAMNSGAQPTSVVYIAIPTATSFVIDVGIPLATTAPTISAAAPPRMQLADFKTLYDDPARRPLIVDVRSAEIFNQHHIAGAINVPGDEVGDKLALLPKEKMIVLYCQ